MTFPLLMIALLIVIAAATSFRQVKAGEAGVLRRRKRSPRLLGPGWHYVGIGGSRVLQKVSLGDQLIELPPTSLTARDGETAVVSGVVKLRVVDSLAAAMNVADLDVAVLRMFETIARNRVKSDELHTLPNAGALAEHVENVFSQVSERWGVTFLSVNVELDRKV